MKNIFGKRYILKSKSIAKNIKSGNFLPYFKNKNPYFNNLSKLIKKKIFKECIACREYFFDWENDRSFARENYHECEHPSQIICPKFFPIFCFDWCHEEESQFFKAILLFGFSNWNMVSLLLGTKTPKECENHFFKFYGELGIKNKKKFWRILPFGFFYFQNLEKWQDFLPICNLKIEKKSGWLPQRCEFLNELEENYEEFFNEFYQKNKKKFDLKIFDENFFFSKYNQKIFFRELRKQTICFGNFMLESTDDGPSFDDSFYIILQQIKGKIKEKRKIKFKKNDLFFKKIRRPFFYGWITNYEYENKNLFEYFCAFKSFVWKNSRPNHEIFFRYLFSNKNFEVFTSQKFFLEKSILTPKEKIICRFTGLQSFQFLIYKTGVIFANFFLYSMKLNLFLKFLPETRISFAIFERFYLDYIKIVKFNF